MFLIDDCIELHVNIVPSNGESSSTALTFQTRILNKEETYFMKDTLILMGIGFTVILLFLMILFKALNI